MKCKKFLIMILTMLLVSTCFGAGGTYPIRYRNVANPRILTRLLLNRIGTLDDEVTALEASQSGIFSNIGTGSVFYVDSGAAADGAGTTWATAFDTLLEGIDACAANNGDIVYVAQAHAEDITNASALIASIAGMTIVGIGNGADMPEISFITDATAELTISAADVCIYNIRFLGAYAGGITAGIQIADAGDGALILGCEFRETSSNMEQLIMINAAADADELVIVGNRFITATGGGNTSAIYLVGGSDKTIIQGNHFLGDWSASVIDGLQAISTEIVIADNLIMNVDAGAGGGKTIQVEATATGVISGNKCYGNNTGFAIAGAAMFISPDNVAMQTENAPERNYETMFGAYTGDGGSGAGDSIYADFVLIDALLDTIIVDTGTDIPASFSTTDGLINGIAASVIAIDGSGWVGTHAGASSTTIVIATLLSGFGEDYFNTDWSMIVLHNVNSDGASPEGEIRDIVNYVDGTGTFTLNYALGANIETGDQVMVKRTEELELDNPTMLGSAGAIWYVSSITGSTGNVGDGTGKTWENAFATVTLADAVCAAGDTVYIAAGHDEEVTTGTLVLDNAANTSFIGLGEGNARPLITCTTDGTALTIDAAGITLKNIRLQSGVTACDVGIAIGSGGIGCTLDNIALIDGEETTVDEFVIGINVNAAASNLTVKNCTYYSLDASNHVENFIDLSGTTIDSPSIIGCTIFGDFSEAAIWGDAAIPVNVLIKDNTISNTESGVACIAFTGAATGICSGNLLYSDDYGTNGVTILDPGSMKCIENYAVDLINETAILVPMSATTDDVTPAPDGSNVERLEYIQTQLPVIAKGSGNIWYADSGASAGNADGKTWANAFDTLLLAIAGATASNGDVIYFAAGHSEALAATTAVDKAGLTFIGMGNGSLQSTITFNDTDAQLTVTVANITFENFHFEATNTDVVAGIALNGTSDGFTLRNCKFSDQTVTTDEFLITVSLATNCDDVTIEGCEFITVGSVATEGIFLGDVVDNFKFINNHMKGTWTVAPVWCDAAITNALFENNLIYQDKTGQFALELTSTATGSIIGNRFYTDSYATMLNPGSMMCIGNMGTNLIDTAGITIPEKAIRVDEKHGTGLVFFVDSGAAASGTGLGWASAMQTVDAAIALCTADRGDTIYVAQGHSEREEATGPIFTMSVEGVSLIGVSNGTPSGAVASGVVTGADSQMPVFVLDHIDAEVSITAANCRLQGIRIESDIADCKIGIVMSNASDGSVIEGCVLSDGADTEELLVGIQVAADADAVQLLNNRITTVINGGCTIGIELVGGMDNGVIKGNRVNGTYATAVLKADGAASVNILIEDNVFITEAVVASVLLNAGTTGIFTDNYMGTGETMLNGLTGDTAIWCFENYISGTHGASGVITPAVDSD